MILHCMKKSTWETRKNKKYWGKRNIDAVMTVLPFIKDKDGVWQKNPEFSAIQNK